MIITGESKSRLSELKKYTVGGSFFDKYFISVNFSVNGVDNIKSNVSSFPQTIVYYIDGIEYKDIIQSNGNTTTTFKFEGQGYNSPDFICAPTYKNPRKENMVQNPKIENDVFINRKEQSVFEKNYNLEYIENLVDLTSFAAGGYFNIVKNS